MSDNILSVCAVETLRFGDYKGYGEKCLRHAFGA